MWIAEKQICAHAAQLLEGEETQLVQPVVDQRAALGLRREHGDEAHEIARESRPETCSDPSGGFRLRTFNLEDVTIHAAFDVLADLAMIAVCITLIVLGWPAVAMLAEFDQRSPAADIPLVIPQALVPIGLGLNAFLVAVRLVETVRARSC